MSLILKGVVYRLPPEPPIGTVLRPEPDTGWRYTRMPEGYWRRNSEAGMGFGWSAVLREVHPSGLVVVEPDPHPTPWHLDDTDSDSSRIFDANRNFVAYLEHPRDFTVAMRIVDAVNKAATT